jgi:Tfp pilus assembly protein PilO
MILIGTALGLVVLNLVAAYFYVLPPGGTQKELRAESQNLRIQVRAARATAGRFERVAAKVQSGSVEATDFANRYFLPERTAYASVVAELQQMANVSGLKPREAAFTEEPVEGSADLSVMNVTENFEGTYDDLMKFLYQVDKSSSLLMLDTLQAAPQQHNNQVNASIRFQAIVRDDANDVAVQQ